MDKQAVYGIGVLVALALMVGVLVYALQPEAEQSTGVELVNNFESNGFRFAYPDGWQHQIPQTNMLFLASPEVLQGENGATITIQRSLRLSSEAATVDEALDIYLERGPLRADRAWTIVEGRETVTFSGRDALQISLEGSEVAGTDDIMRSVIFVTRANNGLVYIFTISAPIEQWESLEGTLTAIVQSVTILE